MRWIAARAAVLLVCGSVGCSSGGGTGVDASGSGGHGASSGSAGAASPGAAGAGGQAGTTASAGAAGAGGQAGTTASAGAAGAGHSGGQGGGGATGVGGSPQGGAGGATFTNCNVIYNCAVGQTCSATNNGQDFACVPSGSSKVGDACTVDPTMIACGDQLICTILPQGSVAQCIQICDASHPCPAGKTCTLEHSQANQPLSICLATTGT